MEKASLEDEDGLLRESVLDMIKDLWRDDRTEAFFTRYLKERPKDPLLSGFALAVLAKYWPKKSRRVEIERFIAAGLKRKRPSYKLGNGMGLALEALARNWSDNKTRNLLESAATDGGTSTSVLSAFALLAKH